MTSLFQKSPLQRQPFRLLSRLFRGVAGSVSMIGKELFLKQESADATGAQSKRLSLEQSLEAVSKPRAAGSPVSRH